MVIERFRPGHAADVYRRFRDSGRMLPDGLVYIDSWVSQDLCQCFQLMDCDDEFLLHQWMSHWKDLVDFDIIPVVSSEHARKRLLKLDS